MNKINKKKSQFEERVALVSTPWPVYNRPSIQLGALKAYLGLQSPSLHVDSHHYYLNIAGHIGFKVYHEISEKSWLAESVYAALLFPEKKEEIRRFFYSESSGCKAVLEAGFDEITSAVKEITDQLIESIDWGGYLLVGFSVCLCQLSSSLYFIKKVKEKYPHVMIAAGGSVFSGLSEKELFNTFSGINYLINGEGEKPLADLVRQLLAGKRGVDVQPSPGLFIQGVDNGSTLLFNQVKDLDELPVPYYGDYFKTIETLHPSKRFFPTLSAEVSRGCWWHRRLEGTENTGCAFCNLNLQWKGYRSKSPEKTVSEVDMLTSGYKSLSVSFMDNVLPVKRSDEIFHRLAGIDKDFSFFCEIRATVSKESLELMKKAGVRYVQVGIEALSSNLLYKINKGTRAVENLEIMKNCEELGLANSSNLIIHFPGSDSDDVAETLSCLDYASVFRPMKTVRFQLGLGSPVMNNPDVFGITTVRNHPNYKILFPDEISNSVRFLNQAYRGDLGIQKKLWKPVVKKVAAWENDYEQLHHEPGAGPILSYRDGKDFILIRHRKIHGEHGLHRLVGSSREIYLFCAKHRTLEEIKNRFPKLSGSAIYSFLSMMNEKKLMFEEDSNYLSLAVRYSSR